METNLKQIFEFIRKDNKVERTKIEETLTENMLLGILINRRWKLDHYKDFFITDLEDYLFDKVCDGIRQYANIISQGDMFADSHTIPFPEYDITMDDLKQKLNQTIEL